VYAWRDGLFGVAFDPKRTKVTSGAAPLVQRVRRSIGVNAAASNYGVSDEGTLTYIAETVSLHSLVWLNRDGTPGGSITSIPPGTYEEPRLSPDGHRVLVTRDGDIWIYDVASGRSNRLTTDGSSQMGVWAPNGARIAYASARKGHLEAWVQPSDGSGESQQLTQLGGQVHVDSWSPDGTLLAIHHHPPNDAVRIFMVPMEPRPGTPRPFDTGDFNAESADFSRDRRYVAYLSTDSGQREISIRAYPGPGGQASVSVGGGREPVWVDNGDIFYRNLTGESFFAVSVKTQPSLQIGRPVKLFQGPYYMPRTGSPRAQYDVTADGRRFLVLAPSSNGDVAATRPHIIVVQNWVEELKRRVLTK
jgi:dipeptidyl aminopeptidase/acylaminoacyl peptidase